MAPPSDGVEWNDGGIEGTKRFLNKFWENIEKLTNLDEIDDSNNDKRIVRKVNQSINSVTKHLDKFEFNTAVSDLMKLNNDLSEFLNNSKEIYNTNELTTTNVKTTDKDQLILDLLAQNKELITMLNETIPKIGNTTNNNTTNNNHFNVQVFLNEDCKDALNFSEFIENMKVSFEDLEHQAEVGYINGVSKLFIENLRDLGTHKRPIHCTDKKRKTLYIKENNEWDKEGSQDTLKKLAKLSC